MRARCGIVVVAMIVCLGGLVLAQEEEAPLQNWAAPPYWQPTRHPLKAERELRGGPVARSQRSSTEPQDLPSEPLPFVAVAPCRIVDTRPGYELPPPFGGPSFGTYETRTYDFSASTTCPGIPATAGAYSLNIHARTTSIPGFVTLWPTGTPRPTASNFVSVPTEYTAVAAIVPAGTAGQIDAYCNSAGDLWIDINGYYGPQSVVTSLNSKAGDVTLAPGSNVTITPAGQTLTIAATGGPGGDLPAGSANQTLRHNGSAWSATSAILTDGTDVLVGGVLNLAATTGTAGRVSLGGSRFLHGFAGAGTAGRNTFVGQLAGNFTMGSTIATEASDNVASGYGSLTSNTTGYANTAAGSFSMNQNTTGYGNTAVGGASLGINTEGHQNTAVGAYSLSANTTGVANSAFGYDALASNVDGDMNAAFGFDALFGNMTGNGNCAFGRNALSQPTASHYNSAFGYQALADLLSGSDNVAVGFSAGQSVATGDNNTFVGVNTGTDFSHPGITNSTAIGANALVLQDDSLVLGNMNVSVGIGTPAPNTKLQVVGNIRVGTSGTNGCVQRFDGTAIAGMCASDARLKTEIRPLDEVLEKVVQLRPVLYRWRADEFPDRHFGTAVNIGLLAQDVERVFPELVSTDDAGYQMVSTSELPYLTLAAVRELKAKTDALEAENAGLRDELKRLAAAVAQLQALQRVEWVQALNR